MEGIFASRNTSFEANIVSLSSRRLRDGVFSVCESSGVRFWRERSVLCFFASVLSHPRWGGSFSAYLRRASDRDVSMQVPPNGTRPTTLNLFVPRHGLLLLPSLDARTVCSNCSCINVARHSVVDLTLSYWTERLVFPKILFVVCAAVRPISRCRKDFALFLRSLTR
jgi:hypothetical protein